LNVELHPAAEAEVGKRGSDIVRAIPQSRTGSWPRSIGRSSYLRGTRRLLLQRFPFSIIYRVESTWVLVVAIAHQRRRPGYWRRRGVKP
jgi:hypothetical protein